MRLQINEKISVWGFRILAAGLLCFFGILLLGFVFKYEFLSIAMPTYEPLALMVIAVVFVLLVFFLNIKVEVTAKKARWRRIICSLLIISSFVMYPIGIFLLSFATHSETTNPKNYLVVDSYVKNYEADISQLFPGSLPKNVTDSTVYRYYYSELDITDDYVFDIFAQCKLTDEQYAAEKQRIAKNFPKGSVHQYEKGEWIVCNFTKFTESATERKNGYYYIIFAYNDKTSSVRYNISYSTYSGAPYFMYELDWGSNPVPSAS